MLKTRSCRLQTMLVAYLLLSATAPSIATQDQLMVGNAHTVMHFYPLFLVDLDVSVHGTPPAELTKDARLQLVSLRETRLTVAVENESLQGVLGGALTYGDDFSLRWHDQSVSMRGFRLLPGDSPMTFEIHAANGDRLFLLDHLHHTVDSRRRVLELFDMDLRLAPELARRLGDERYSGLAVGTLNLSAEILTPLRAAGSGELGNAALCAGRPPNYRANFNDDPNDDLAVDVRLDAIDSVSCSRCGSDVVNVIPSATLQNVGAADIPWFWRFTGPNSNSDPLNSPRELGAFEDYGGFLADGGYVPEYNEQHPYLVWALYRIGEDASGETFDHSLTPLGQSNVKHGYFANNDFCECPSGQVFWAASCSDLYGSGTNSDIQHLGPRSEINPRTGRWQHRQSHFDPDGDEIFNVDIRPPGAGGLNYESLAVATHELEQAGEFYLEAWYIVKDDINVYNSMGHRRIKPVFNGNIWQFQLDGPMLHGPFINTWVDPQLPPTSSQHKVLCSTNTTGEGHPPCAATTGNRGHLQLAVRTDDLGDGRYGYHYALMNLDFDGRISELRIPLPDDATVSDIHFADPDATAENDWISSEEDSGIAWRPPTPDSALDWGTMYTFGFVADQAPVDSVASLHSQRCDKNLVVVTLAPAAETKTAASNAMFGSGFEECD